VVDTLDLGHHLADMRLQILHAGVELLALVLRHLLVFLLRQRLLVAHRNGAEPHRSALDLETTLRCLGLEVVDELLFLVLEFLARRALLLLVGLAFESLRDEILEVFNQFLEVVTQSRALAGRHDEHARCVGVGEIVDVGNVGRRRPALRRGREDAAQDRLAAGARRAREKQVEA